MLVYWLMFLIPAGMALAHPQARLALRSSTSVIGWLPAWLLLTILIGYRQSGGDWYNYLMRYFGFVGTTFSEALEHGSDPGYSALNWLMIEWGWGFYGVNLVCGALFSWGLIVFCRHQPRPWLALAAAVPYLVIVVGMGYSRQAVAIGLAMIGLVALMEKSNPRFVLWVCLAALFHKSAVILLPLAVLATSRGRWWTALWVGVMGAMAYTLLLQEHVDSLVQNYVEAEYQSQGAAIRVAMNAVPAVLFLLYRRRLALEPQAYALWTWIALISLGFVVLLVASPATTAIDRIALYFIPLQLFVFSRLPELWGQRKAAAGPVLSVLAYYTLVLFVWLNYAGNAFMWLPYRFYWFN
jgi:hypothetical protein